MLLSSRDKPAAEATLRELGEIRFGDPKDATPVELPFGRRKRLTRMGPGRGGQSRAVVLFIDWIKGATIRE